MDVCKVKEVYIVGIPHVIAGYLQDVAVVYNKGDKWIAQKAEHFRTNDKEVSSVLKNVMYATTEDDFEEGIERAVSQGARVQRIEVKKWNLPFPKNLVEGKVKLQKEVD
ncbi:hypothetical protein [Sulfuracidifex tepidarius]|uniref:Uncharacterized protein n=1 Tax=Sulfuracidifex tepidarius TaxID=1294262 RepID=A0A510DSC8_9CREN|nr:hypothetical protein [Sulfuracidifex tepidarius]BBG23078.1 hypothetical protein IC006_0362 [Sulfuracidifex tepidarius]BBG25826.1 hypothetical protein IC007_0331 [Sulfuracidifex tepidarius]